MRVSGNLQLLTQLCMCFLTRSQYLGKRALFNVPNTINLVECISLFDEISNVAELVGRNCP